MSHFKIIVTIALLSTALSSSAQDLEKVDLKKPVQFSGSINLTLENYSSNGIEARRKPFSWLITGTPTVTIYGVQLPFSFLFSNFENRYYQPFNQFGLSPRYKWATLHLGYRNIQFNPFTLGGYRMLGAGVELKPKGFRFGFMYGRIARSTEIDSAQNANPLAFRGVPSYTRMAYAVKVGVGSDDNYLDLSYLKGWDVESSMKDELRDTIAPAKNSAFGVAWKKSFFKKKLFWQTDVGVSYYTTDIHAPKVADSFQKDDLGNRVLNQFDARWSSSLLVAGETRIGYVGKKVGVAVAYRRIDPNYRSMGAYFFQSDLEQYSLLPSLRLDSGKLFISGTLGIQKDNLSKLKLATSKRFIANANINYNPNQKFGVSFNYSNFGITQNPTRTSPNSEYFKQVSQNFVLTPYLNFTRDKSSDNVTAIASYQSLNSPVKTINAAADQHTLFGSLMYSHVWFKNGLSVNASVNYNNTNLPQGDIGSAGGGIGGSIPLFHQKLTIGLNTIYNSNVYNGVANGYTFNGDLSLSAPIAKKHTVQLQANYLKNTAKDQTVLQTFDELIVRFSYGFRL